MILEHDLTDPFQKPILGREILYPKVPIPLQWLQRESKQIVQK